MKIGIIGSGAMGSGIAQVAAQAGHEVILNDTNTAALDKSRSTLEVTLNKLIEKGKMTAESALALKARITYSDQVTTFGDVSLVIEAIVENLEIKKKVFAQVEAIVSNDCVLATNTSSLSVTAIAAGCKDPSRLLGIHFFNPAPVMPLVEIIPGLQTNDGIVNTAKSLIASWGKTVVVCRDTPGFIVNRVARPFYSEALRIYDEGLANFSTIDQAMRVIGFRMGPFELMDMIGNDVNYAVTESVFASFYFDPRFKPSITQKKLNEAMWLGRKTGRGYYNYQEGASIDAPDENPAKRKMISDRILAMLINEAYDSLYYNVASSEDLDTAMTKGVNYPKGLIQWGQEIGLDEIRKRIETLYEFYQDDRYRLSPGIKAHTSMS